MLNFFVVTLLIIFIAIFVYTAFKLTEITNAVEEWAKELEELEESDYVTIENLEKED